MEINADRRVMAVDRIRELVGDFRGKVIGLLGLSFKPNTDDMRDAPSIDIAHALQAQGAVVKAYDPVAMEVARVHLPGVDMAPDAYALAEGCDALVVVTEWNEFKQLDLERIYQSMRQPVIFDGRNIYEPEAMKRYGFDYRGVGSGYLSDTDEAG